MGNCSSCLGARRRSTYDEDEESRLLFDEASGAHYGSFGEPSVNDQDQAQESQREFEALQSVVARTSDNMVDVFEISRQRTFSHASQAARGLGIADSRASQYQNLLSKLSITDETDAEARLEECVYVEPASHARPDAALPIQVDAAGPFVGNFAEAAKVRS